MQSAVPYKRNRHCAAAAPQRTPLRQPLSVCAVWCSVCAELQQLQKNCSSVCNLSAQQEKDYIARAQQQSRLQQQQRATVPVQHVVQPGLTPQQQQQQIL